MFNTADVLFDEQGPLGVITLNRPKALNALTLEMTVAIYEQLKLWEQQKHIKAIIIKAVEGKAFCAGGDIRQVHELREKSGTPATEFFWHEYRLNYCIYHYPKPFIALLNGLTMGGGAGISIHGSHRVATENFVFAMPETGIGFFPDIGATFFLPRCPEQTGIFLGLTGTCINAGDALTLKLIMHYVESENFPALITTLTHADFSVGLPQDVVTDTINKFISQPDTPSLKLFYPHINMCFAHQTVETILHALESHHLDWCHQTANTLKKKSPTSLKVTLRALRHGALLTFDQCMQTEYQLAVRFLHQDDFYEGVRAVIIDKDKQPKWHPAYLSEVDENDINAYFAPLIDIPELTLA